MNDAESVTLFITLSFSSEATELDVLFRSAATASRQGKEKQKLERRELQEELGQSSPTLPPSPFTAL